MVREKHDEKLPSSVWCDFGDGEYRKIDFKTAAERDAFADGILMAGNEWGIDDFRLCFTEEQLAHAMEQDAAVAVEQSAPHGEHECQPTLTVVTAASTMNDQPNSFSECDNCGAAWQDGVMDEIEDFWQRATPGAMVPSGQCPDCGALCYPTERGAK